MSIASPTLRSSSSTVPGPSLSRLPISMRARPSTAETWTGTSNTASRSAAVRVVGPSGSGAIGTSALPAPASRLGSGTLPSSFMRGSPQGFLCIREAAPRADVARHGLGDRCFGRGAVAVSAAVRPLDAAVANRDIRLGEDDEAALEAGGPCDRLELFPRHGIERVIDADDDVRRRDELAEAFARQRRDFGEGFERDQGGRELARHGDRHLDRLAFEPRFDG